MNTKLKSTNLEWMFKVFVFAGTLTLSGLIPSISYATYYGCSYEMQVQFHFSKTAYGKAVRSVVAHSGVLTRRQDSDEAPRTYWQSVVDINLTQGQTNGDFTGRATLSAEKGGGDGSIKKLVAPIVEYIVTFADGTSLTTDETFIDKNTGGTELVSVKPLGGMACSSSVFERNRWVGNFRTHISRASTTPCSGRDVIPYNSNETIIYDSWVRTRATAHHLCFEVFSEGKTESNINFKENSIGVSAVVSFSTDDKDKASSPIAAQYIGHNGNNAVYAVNLSNFDSFAWPHNNSADKSEKQFVLTVDDKASDLQHISDRIKIRFVK